MSDRDLESVLQEIAAGVNLLVARLESLRLDAPETFDGRDALLGALKCAVELAQLRHAETHRRLKLIEQAFERLAATADIIKLREDLDKRVAKLSADMDRRVDEIRQDAADRGCNNVNLYWDLKQRLVTSSSSSFPAAFRTTCAPSSRSTTPSIDGKTPSLVSTAGS